MRPRDQGPSGGDTRAACGEHQARQNKPHLSATSRRTASLETYGSACLRRSRISSCRSLEEDSDSTRCLSPLPCEVGCTGPDFFNLPPAAFSVKLNVSCSRAFDSDDSDSSPRCLPDPQLPPADTDPAVNGVKAVTLTAVSGDVQPLVKPSAQPERLSPDSQTALKGSRYEGQEEAEEEVKTTSTSSAIAAIQTLSLEGAQQQVDSRTAFMAQRKSVKELYGQPSWWGDDEVEDTRPPPSVARSLADKSNSADDVEKCKAPPSPRSTVTATPRRPAEAFTVDFGGNSMSSSDRRRRRPPPPPPPPQPSRVVSRGKVENTTRQPRTTSATVSAPRRGIGSSARTTPQRDVPRTRPATANAATRARPRVGISGRTPQQQQQPDQRRPLSARPAPRPAAAQTSRGGAAAIKSSTPTPALQRRSTASSSVTRGVRGTSTKTALSRRAPESSLGTHSPGPSSPTTSSRLLQRNRIPLRRGSTNSASPKVATTAVQPPAAVSPRFAPVSSARGQSAGQPAVRAGDAGVRGASMTPTTRRLTPALEVTGKQPKPSPGVTVSKEQDIKSRAAATGTPPSSRPTRTLFNSLKKPTTVFPSQSAASASGKHQASPPAANSQVSEAIPGAADSVAAYIMSFEDPKDYLFDQMFSGINLTHQCSTNNVFQAFNRGSAAQRESAEVAAAAGEEEEEDLNGCVRTVPDEKTGQAMAASPPLPDEPPVEVASNIASNLENFGRTFTRKKLPSNQFADYWQNNPPLPTPPPVIKSAVQADVNTHGTQPSVEITAPEATTSALTNARTPSPPLDANLCQAVSVDSLAPSCAGTYILDVNDTLAAEGIPPVVIGEKAETSSEIANIMITSNTCTLPHRRSPSPAVAGSRDSLDAVNADNPDEDWEERRNGEKLQVNDDHLKEAFQFNREETKGGAKSAAIDKERFTKTSEEIELKTYGNSHHHDISSSSRQSHSDYADRTVSTTQQTPQPSKQRVGVVESERQSKRHQARADKSAKNAVSAFGKHVKNGHASRERSSSNSITCSRADVRHSVSSGFMDVAPETSMLTASDSQQEHLRSPPLPPTSYTGQCSCMPPPPYTTQESRLLSTLPDHDQFLRYGGGGGARSNSCSSASPQLIEQLKDEFDQALADICYHSETYSGYTGLPEYSNTTHASQCQTTQNKTFSFPQLRGFDFDPRSQNQQPPVQPPQRLTDVGVDYPQGSGYFTQGYACLEAFQQQPPDLLSPTQEQRRSAFRPYELCPTSVQPRAVASLMASDVPCCFRQSSRTRSPSRISPQAASLAPALRKRNSWDWEWTETSGGGIGEGLRRHSSRSSVHSEIAGPSYMSSSSAAAAAVWRSRRLRRQHEDYRQPPLHQKNVSAARVGRTTATQYLPMRSAISAASLDTDVLTQESADALTDAVRHCYNGMPPNNAVQGSVASSLPGNQSTGRGNEFATNKADTGAGTNERIPFADEVVTTGVSASNNLAERPSAFTRLVTNCEPLPPGLSQTVLSRRVIPPPLSMKLFNESAVAPPSDPQRLDLTEKNASMESPSCGSLSAATPGVRGTTLSSPLTRSAIFCADSSDSSSVLTYSPPSLSCISDHVIPTGVRKNQRSSLTKRVCPRRHSLRTGSANTRHPRADSPTAEDITNNGYSPPYAGLLSKQRCPPGVSDPLTTTTTTTSAVPTPGAAAVASTPGRAAGALSKLIIPTSTGHSEAVAVTGCANSGALGRSSRNSVSSGERQEHHQHQAAFSDSLSSGGPKTDVYVTAIATTSSGHHQAGLDPAVMPSAVNGVRPGSCFDEFSIQRPIAKRLDPEDHRMFALAYPQNFPPSSSSSSAVGAALQGDTQPLLRCLGPEQRSNLAERSRRSISLGPTQQSPMDFYLDTGGSGFRLSSTALADSPKESYETLLASSILHLSNRLRRCSNSLAQRIGAAGCENSGLALESGGLPTARTGISSSASPHQEGNDLLTNMREVEQQLQHMESILFPLSKSGRTSVTGSCSETEYLQELERINSEISGFVPITAIKADADESSPLNRTQTSAMTITKRPLASTVNNQQWRPSTTEGDAQNDTGDIQEDPLLTEEYY